MNEMIPFKCWKIHTEAATETISKISVMFFQEHLFYGFIQEAVCSYRTDANFLREVYYFILRTDTFFPGRYVCVLRTDTDFPGANFQEGIPLRTDISAIGLGGCFCSLFLD